MNREVLKAIDTNVIPISRLAALFDTFGLRHSSKVLPDLLEAAEQGNASYKQRKRQLSGRICQPQLK